MSGNKETWQLCPKCSGQGHVNKPPYIAGDQHSWVAGNTGGYQCPVCAGRGMVALAGDAE